MPNEPWSPFDERRRQILLALLAVGAFSGPHARAGLLGRQPGPLPAGQSIYRLEGEVKVDGTLATRNTHINAGALVETGARSKIVSRRGPVRKSSSWSAQTPSFSAQTAACS